MTKPNPLPSAGYLREMLEYEPQTGVLTWKKRPLWHFEKDATRVHSMWNTKNAGRPAGYRTPLGYLAIHINGKVLCVHRICWKLQTGSDPTDEIDHRDGNRSNNAWSNLREATFVENKHNRGLGDSNTSGHKGVSWDNRAQKWRASINANYQRHHLGLHATPDSAAAAYRDAAKMLHGEYANTGDVRRCRRPRKENPAESSAIS